MYRFDAPLCDANAEQSRARVRGLVKRMLGNSSRSSPTAGTTGRVRRPWAACATCPSATKAAGFLRVDMLDSVEQALGSIGVGR